MDKEQQQAAFEQKFANPRRLSISRYDNVYADELTQLPWEAWQAAIEQASQRIAQLEAYIGDNLHKKAICGCGDSIEPDDGAVCGNCMAAKQASQPKLPLKPSWPSLWMDIQNGYDYEYFAAYLDEAVSIMVEKATEQASQPQGTPSSRWAAEGQPDPHDDRYNCERAELTLGSLTDDELANAAFMNYDRWPRLEDIIAGNAHPPIAYMTAVKDRIRWLSRKLEQASQPPEGYKLVPIEPTDEMLAPFNLARSTIYMKQGPSTNLVSAYRTMLEAIK